MVFAALCHDMGKPKTTKLNPEVGRITTWNHHEAGVPIAESFLHSIGAPAWLIEKVVPLVRHHMAAVFMKGNAVSRRAVRRLAVKLHPVTISQWFRLCLIDSMARPGRDDVGQVSAEVRRVMDLAYEMDLMNQKPEPILMGRHLLFLGLKPGRHIGEILEKGFSAQLDGEFDDLAGAFEWCDRSIEFCTWLIPGVTGEDLAADYELGGTVWNYLAV
jgi:tRNA nucleotidyltransferase (CCA-adding enzyme)